MKDLWANCAHNAFFEVQPKQKGQKPILFGRIETKPVACVSSGGNSESPQFFHYGQKSRHMMKRMEYNFTKGSGLNFDEGKQTLLHLFVPKCKDSDYCHKTRRGLSYISTPISSNFESKEEVYNDSSSATSLCDSDVSVYDIFESLSINKISTSDLEDDREDTFKSKELI